MGRRGIGTAAVFAALWVALGSAAAATETAAAIRAAIAAALEPRLAGVQNATAEIGAIDARLQLPSCPDVEVSLPAASGAAIAAKVDCRSPNWTIYVPVRLHAWVEAVVAAANLAPNTTLSADLLSRSRIDAFAANGGLITEPARAEGKILRVGLIAGAPILASFLEMPLVVHRGQTVLLTVTDGTMAIRDSVLALEDGRIGDSIAMQNPQSQKIVHGSVTGDGTAEIRF